MKIVIETIPHKEQRYETIGDWFYGVNGEIVIKVSKLGDDRYNFLVAIHELIEAFLCTSQGILQKDVDAFDIDFELHRTAGDHGYTGEPGDSVEAPYKRQHCIATGVERLLAAELEVDWQTYEERIKSL